MSGEELKKKLKGAGISQAEVARRLGVVPQSVIQSLEAKDIKSGFIEDLCRVLNKNLAFFYDMPASSPSEDLAKLKEENERLKEELRMIKDPEQPRKESEAYRLWMEHMKLSEQQMALSERMRELYQKQKEG